MIGDGGVMSLEPVFHKLIRLTQLDLWGKRRVVDNGVANVWLWRVWFCVWCCTSLRRH